MFTYKILGINWLLFIIGVLLFWSVISMIWITLNRGDLERDLLKKISEVGTTIKIPEIDKKYFPVGMRREAVIKILKENHFKIYENTEEKIYAVWTTKIPGHFRLGNIILSIIFGYEAVIILDIKNDIVEKGRSVMHYNYV